MWGFETRAKASVFFLYHKLIFGYSEADCSGFNRQFYWP